MLQEADESQLWLELLRDDCSIPDEQMDHLLGETNELPAIFTSMVVTLRQSGQHVSISAFQHFSMCLPG